MINDRGFDSVHHQGGCGGGYLLNETQTITHLKELYRIITEKDCILQLQVKRCKLGKAIGLGKFAPWW
jgi:hypothetical protein